MTVAKPLLSASDVVKHYRVGGGRGQAARRLVAVDQVSLEVYPGETLGLVGESGCGKSTLGRCLMRLYDIDAGSITFAGSEIGQLSRRRLLPFRRQMQMVFQDPYASLNPRRRVGDLLAEPLIVHGLARGRAIRERVAELLQLVELNPDHAMRYPHEFSGGQRQRIGIARALALEPRLIIADEPVSALDVSIQAQVINLLTDLRDRLALTYVFIAHDLSVVRHISSRVAVMYLGRIVETGPVDMIFDRPAHPYTRALLSAVPVVDPGSRRQRIRLEGDVPSPLNPPSGCRFRTRCPAATARCAESAPSLMASGGGHFVACHHPMSG